jgi:Fe-S-cluster containining protein
MTNRKKNAMLPVVADCEGCGVCCFHMGYPAFIVPRDPMTDEEIDANPTLKSQVDSSPIIREELRKGNPGEPYWHSMPDDLKAEWESYVAEYRLPDYDSDPRSFDGPCSWLDLETRRCKHHDHRPRVCRDFKTGSNACHQWRDYYRDKILLN